ncbi:MAG: hypothetical protein DRN29_03795 [Thermoplasmata archaeon]|nr:MAG: hypothetical protein DRN29_03795 [Thermoplasmata archaeon]
MRRVIIIAIIIFALSLFPVKAKEYYYERVEINLPDEMKYQPVDIKVEFDEPCYALNEKKHSIRVFYNGREIESQIYNLQFKGSNIIKSCNIVFLYQGKGEYLIRYGKEMEEINYEDHVEVKDSYYYTEPLPGYFAKLNYYEIRENGKSLFGVCQEGSILGIEMGNKVIKMEENADKFEMSKWRQIFSFALFYSDGEEIGSDEKLIGKKIIVDGNLMTRVAIETASRDGKLKTKAIYTYYYSPTDDKRLFVSLQHEAYEGWEGNVTYAYIMAVKTRSKTIEELNMGQILPYIHLNGENGIEEYKLDTNPENKEYRWIISAKNNVYLGNPPWVAVDDKRRAYVFIFSTEKLKVTAAVKEEVGVPGLEIDGGGISIGENGEIKGGKLYEGLIEVFCGSYENIGREVEAFFDFKNFRNFEAAEEVVGQEKRYNLTVTLHLRHSIPFLPYIATFFGIKLPYMEVEIWNNGIVAKGTVNFRKISFELPEGEYVVRVYYNGFRSRKYIGAKYVKLESDSSIHIFCSFEGILNVNTIEGAKIRVLKDGGIVAENISKGKEMLIRVPAMQKYTVQIIYNGFLMEEEEIFLLFHLRKSYEFNTYDFVLKVRDKLGMEPGVNITCFMSSEEMVEDMKLYGEKRGGIYVFNGLPEGEYKVVASYKGYKVEKRISIPQDKEAEIIFPAEYKVNVKAYDKRGFRIKARVIFEREDKEFKENMLPPAEYTMKIYDGRKLVASKKILLASDSNYEIVTKKSSFYPYIIPVLILALFILRRKIEILFALLLSLSFIFSWWNIKGESTTALYMFPPKMIELKATYGNIVSLPSLLPQIFLIVLALLLICIIFISLFPMDKLFKFSIIPLMISLITFIYAISKFANVTVGSVFGEGFIEGSHAEWGLGLGFYFALLSLILITGKVVRDEIRRSG